MRPEVLSALGSLFPKIWGERAGGSDWLCLREGKLQEGEGGSSLSAPSLGHPEEAEGPPFPTARSRLLPPRGASSALGQCGRRQNAAAPAHGPCSNLPGDNKLQSLVRKITKASNKHRKKQKTPQIRHLTTGP